MVNSFYMKALRRLQWREARAFQDVLDASRSGDERALQDYLATWACYERDRIAAEQAVEAV